MLQRHRGNGLDGVEVYYGVYDAIERRKWERVAEDLDLVATAGSDHHDAGDALHGIDVGDDAGKRLLEWLALG